MAQTIARAPEQTVSDVSKYQTVEGPFPRWAAGRERKFFGARLSPLGIPSNRRDAIGGGNTRDTSCR